MKIEYRTMTGCGSRPKNEDTFGIVELPERDRYMFIVCDGMSGYKCGDIASKAVVDAFCKYWKGHPDEDHNAFKIENAGKEAVALLNAQEPKCDMATTLMLLSFDNGSYIYAQAGDTRIYTIRGKNGTLFYSRDDVVKNPEGIEVVSCAFQQGCSEDIVPISYQYHSTTIKPGEIFLICTDGVWRTLTHPQIRHLLGSGEYTLDEMIEQLEEHCKSCASDNYTAIIVQITE